jgi:Family of unknown function (DUF6221)
MDELGAFLKARLDEAAARANAMEHFTVHEQEWNSCPASLTEPPGDLPWGEGACDCHLAERKARALREVAAKRALLELAEEAYYEADHYVYHRIRSVLAAINSDHPDYRAVWAPAISGGGTTQAGTSGP